MKLTNQMREEFVAKAMQDVPNIDYRTQVQDLLNRASINAMPPLVRAAYDKHPEFIASVKEYFSNWGYIHFVGIAKISPEIQRQMDEYVDADKEQMEALSALRTKLRAVAASATTVEKLLQFMPEFEKYIPTKTAVSANLPAISNLVADFVAAGWPSNTSQGAAV